MNLEEGLEACQIPFVSEECALGCNAIDLGRWPFFVGFFIIKEVKCLWLLVGVSSLWGLGLRCTHSSVSEAHEAFPAHTYLRPSMYVSHQR